MVNHHYCFIQITKSMNKNQFNSDINSKYNKILKIIISAILLWFFFYFFAYQIGKFYYYITH